MVMLTSISNDAINDNLKKRFAADLIYVRWSSLSQLFFFQKIKE